MTHELYGNLPCAPCVSMAYTMVNWSLMLAHRCHTLQLHRFSCTSALTHDASSSQRLRTFSPRDEAVDLHTRFTAKTFMSALPGLAHWLV